MCDTDMAARRKRDLERYHRRTAERIAERRRRERQVTRRAGAKRRSRATAWTAPTAVRHPASPPIFRRSGNTVGNPRTHRAK